MIKTAINLYEQLFDQGLIPRCMITMEGGIVLTNEAFRKIFNLSGTHFELKSQNLFDVLANVTGIHRDIIRKDQLFYCESEKVSDGKINIVQNDGTKLKLDYQRSRIELDGISMLAYEWQDVTEKLEYRKSLRSTYERLQLAASISSLGIWEYDFENKDWFLNEHMLRIFGLKQTDQAQLTQQLLAAIDVNDVEALKEKWIEIRTQGGRLDIEFRIHVPEQGIRNIHCLGKCLLDVRHQPWKFVGTLEDITRQKQDSQALILDRNRMRSLVDAQNSLLIRIDKSGSIVFSNLSFNQYFGINELCSKSIWLSPFLLPEKRDLLQKTVAQCFAEPGKSHILLLQLKNSQGEFRLQEWELAGIVNHAGEVDEIQGIGRDVSEQHELNSRIQEAHSNIESLINNFNEVSIWSIDTNYKLTACNDHFIAEHFSYYGNKVKNGDNLLALFAPNKEHYTFWKGLFDRVFSGEQFELEMEVGGHMFNVSFNPIYVSGKVTGAAIYGMDITASRLAVKALKFSEERLNFAIEGNQYGVWDYDVVNDNLYFSDSCKAMLGYDLNELESKLINWSEIIHPGDIENVTAIRRDVLIGNKEGFRNEVRMKTQSGQYKWILDKGKTYERDEHGKPTRIIGLLLDISKQKADEAKLNEYLQRLEKFAYITSHNLRLPVANIIGLSNMLDEATQRTKEDETILRKIKTSAQQIDDVIKEMNEAISFSNQQTRKPQQTSLKNIWFIDDDDINNLLSERLIGKHFPGTGCRTFLDAEEALEELQSIQEKPDAIFLDINMPHMNGWEFLEELQKLKVAVNVYMLTSSIDPRDQQRAHSYTLVKDFISKPLREDRLRMIVE